MNAAGSFFAGGGAVAAGYTGHIGGSGTTAYNNHTAKPPLQGTWRISAGKNHFGGEHMTSAGAFNAVEKIQKMGKNDTRQTAMSSRMKPTVFTRRRPLRLYMCPLSP